MIAGLIWWLEGEDGRDDGADGATELCCCVWCLLSNGCLLNITNEHFFSVEDLGGQAHELWKSVV